MPEFMIRFLICNLILGGMIAIILLLKHVLKYVLTNRMQYNIWFILPALFMIPFLPFDLYNPIQLLNLASSKFLSPATSSGASVTTPQTIHTDWTYDFAVSVSSKSDFIGYCLFYIWLVGIFAMLLLFLRSAYRLYTIKKSALTIDNQQIQTIYMNSFEKTGIKKRIPLYTSVFLNSPAIIGIFAPRIYLPKHLVSNYDASELHYILLHELQHYKHKDNLISCFINLSCILYWFNPAVWVAVNVMQNDREIACDASVLNLLSENDYKGYGNTLINYAEKISRSPFAMGLGGKHKQIRQRIIHIASYKKPTFRKKIKSTVAFFLTMLILLSLSPLLSTHAANKNHYKWNQSSESIASIELSSYFGDYEGCFVFYDLKNDTWTIYNQEKATLRIAPDSTYKIYDALFGLEEGIITPEQSFLAWDKTNYPFEQWNRDQTLDSAMHDSVNWYFQTIDRTIGKQTIQNHIQNIEYGNQRIQGDLSTYWMESSLKISPIEQVELLVRLYNHNLYFSKENVDAVLQAICISSSGNKALYGKTGTGRIDENDVNGWFIGYVESSGNTYFFATNIQADQFATGSKAADITLNVLSDMQIYKP